MPDFKQRFQIIYNRYATLGTENGFKPSRLAFSRFMGVSQGRMQQWEKGKLPGGEDLKTIHDKLGFAYDWLIAGEGEMFDTAAQRISDQEKEIARLNTQIFIEGASDQDGRTDTDKTGEGQG